MDRLFDPWRGDDYYAGLRNSLKLLIVGDSHYGRSEGPLMTKNVVVSHVSDGCHTFFDRIRDVAGGLENSFSREIFWSRVSFCNFIAESLPCSDSVPTNEQFQQGWKALKETLQELEPDIMLVFSRTCWNWCSNELESDSKNVLSGNVDPMIDDVWRYHRQGRKPLIAAALNHPRMPAVRASMWRVWTEHVWQRAMAQRFVL